MLFVSVGITNGVPATGMTVPLGPITVPAGMLAGLTAMPALAGVGLVLVPSDRERVLLVLEEDPVLPNTAAVNTSAACTAGLIAGRVTASAASTIPCLTKCIFQQVNSKQRSRGEGYEH